MTSTFTGNKYLEEPANGDYVNLWNIPNNNNFTVIDAALGRQATVTVTGVSTTQTLNAVVGSPITNGAITIGIFQYQCQTLIFTGTLGVNLTYLIPSGVSGMWNVYNATSGAYTLTIASAGSVAGGVTIPQGSRAQILCDGGVSYGVTVATTSSLPVGTINAFAGTTAPSQWYLCYGQSLSTTTYSALFSAIGYTYGGSGGSFNVPDLRGRTLAGLDNMGGTNANRLSSVLSSTTLGAAGGDQNLQAHAHGVNDPGHSHGVNDPGHIHGLDNVWTNDSAWPFVSKINASPNNFYGQTQTSTGYTGIYLNYSYTGISIANTGAGSSGNVQPTAIINYIIYAAA